MNILFFGDVVARSGRRALRQVLPDLAYREQASLVIANCENVAGGKGVDPKSVQELREAGVDVLTSGNHVWQEKSILPVVERDDRLLRPANFPPGVPGRGWCALHTADGIPVAVVNLIGRVFLPLADCPFAAAERILDELAGSVRVIVVDMHAEATSEKGAMGWFLDGRVSAVIGTHTHVQTADERVLPGGTAFLTDAGMCGPWNSVIGVEPLPVIRRFRTQMPERFSPARGPAVVQGAVLTVDPGTGRAIAIRRIQQVVGEVQP